MTLRVSLAFLLGSLLAAYGTGGQNVNLGKLPQIDSETTITVELKTDICPEGQEGSMIGHVDKNGDWHWGEIKCVEIPKSSESRDVPPKEYSGPWTDGNVVISGRAPRIECTDKSRFLLYDGLGKGHCLVLP